MGEMTIGQVSKKSNISIETIRYYEKRGLLNCPKRSKAGYRLYEESIFGQLTFIKKAQILGFSLSEIAKLLSIYNQDVNINTAEVYAYTAQKIAEIESKIEDLQHIRSILKKASEDCFQNYSACNCPIIDEIRKGDVANVKKKN